MKRRDLIEVIQEANAVINAILENWEEGNLAQAVREAANVQQEYILPALEWWDSDE